MSRASSSIAQRALNARHYYDQRDKVLAIGKTTEWSDPADVDVTDRNPPTPTGLEVNIEEPIAYKRIDECWMAKKYDKDKGYVEGKDYDRLITYRDEKFMIAKLPANESERPTSIPVRLLYEMIYISAKLIYDEVPLVTYRQVGLYSLGEVSSTTFDTNNVAYPTGTVGKTNILSDPGILAVIDYRKPQPRDWDQTEIFKVMIQF